MNNTSYSEVLSVLLRTNYLERTGCNQAEIRAVETGWRAVVGSCCEFKLHLHVVYWGAIGIKERIPVRTRYARCVTRYPVHAVIATVVD